MTYKELMFSSLSQLLETGEVLRYPLYGTLIQKGGRFFGYFGLTDTHLLIALLNGSKNWVSRIPLDIKDVKVKKSLFPLQRIVKINFNTGNPCIIRFSSKVYGIDTQKENLEHFINEISEISVKGAKS